MSEALTMRTATPADAALITHQRRAMFAEVRPDIAAETFDAMDINFLAWVRTKLENGTYLGWFYVNESTVEVVAGAGLWLMEWPPHMVDVNPVRGYILNVYTDPNYRGRGLARALTQTCVDYCRAQGIKMVTLHASPFGKPIYDKMGFEQSNEMRMNLG
ncbi:MAG: GNAT family N-acetyltransferase [Anaerolineae bacterium]|nr:GNAT family N-acetyltransferase [Anaerolineae bacterium]